MDNPYSLEGKRVLVTGASSGIGRCIAVAAAKMGANVIVAGRSVERLNETLSMMHSGDHQELSLDLSRISDFANAITVLPKLDGVVHCAGVRSYLRRILIHSLM